MYFFKFYCNLFKVPFKFAELADSNFYVKSLNEILQNLLTVILVNQLTNA